ncbi:MAG: hypothetical protein Q7W55_00235 [Pseudohongiella sp.]|nr:hypothetical protein [Pseudohongiella sp.]MDO9521036.1 hypothetical protein [Pseudohongiella sp.]MDP2128970.1 hypothetical protein [Pseudohongiella sp.]
MILKTAALLFSIGMSASAFSAEAGTNYTGIWQDTERSSDYYVIQENGENILLIALPGIESTADTLRYSYMGDKSDLRVARLSAEAYPDIHRQVQLHFESPDQGSFYPICEVCSVVVVNIVKVF